jgi:hypothetical protein
MPRLQLLWRHLGCNTVAEFFRDHEKCVQTLGDHMLLCLSWIKRRHLDDLLAWPWPMSVLGDDRASPDLQKEIAREWFTSSLLRLDPYFGRRLRESKLIPHYSVLLEDKNWKLFFHRWSEVVSRTVTNAQVEFRHTRYDRKCPQRNSQVSTFVAKAFHCEQTTVMNTELADNVDRSSSPACSSTVARTPVKGMAAKQIFHQRIHGIDRERGIHWRVATQNVWNNVKGMHSVPLVLYASVAFKCVHPVPLAKFSSISSRSFE